MRAALRRGPFPALLLALDVIACQGSPGGSIAAGSASPSGGTSAAPSTAAATPAVTLSPVGGPLGEAMAFVSAATTRLSFTDWRAIKAANGSEGVTGADPIAVKLEAIRSTIGNPLRREPPSDAPAVAFGGQSLRSNVPFTYWGFDLLDLDWEAELVVGSGRVVPIRVLHFRAGFDFSALRAHLDEYGYASAALPKGVLRAKADFGSAQIESVDGSPIPLATTTGIWMGNVGFLDDGRTLVLGWSSQSPDPAGEAVRAILTTGPADAADPSLRSVAAILDAPTSALLDRSLPCSALATSERGAQELVDAALEAAGRLAMWNTFGWGYHRVDTPVGLFVFGYAVAEEATGDLAARRTLAESGPRLRAPRTYADVFSVVDARVIDRSVVLSVAPRDNYTGLLLQLATTRDLLFGACRG